jgi:PhnB protein
MSTSTSTCSGFASGSRLGWRQREDQLRQSGCWNLPAWFLRASPLDVTRFPGSDVIAHVELDFGTGKMTLGAAMKDYCLIAADPSHGASFSLALYVPDPDQLVERAVSSGATLREPLTTFVSGARYASLIDPFGVRWSIMTRVEDLSFDESRRRVADWAKQQGEVIIL